MKEIILDKLHFENFKSFERFTFEVNGRNAVVTGANGTGKTSIKEGLLWLLFGKASDGSDLNPKPLDSDNNEVLGLEPVVEAHLKVNGIPTTIRRELRERWTKATGDYEKTYKGNTTKYFIDDVPKKQSDFKAFVQSLVDEEHFKILANSNYFMSDSVHWKKRREIIVEMANVTDQDVLSEHAELKEVGEWLENKTIEDLTAQFKSEKKRNIDEIERIPVQINQTKSLIEDLKEKAGKSPEEVKLSISNKESEIETLQEKINEARAGSVIAQLQVDLTNLKAEENEKRSSYSQSLMIQTDGLRNDVRHANNKKEELKAKASELNFEMQKIQREIDNKTSIRNSLLEKWNNTASLMFSKDETVCKCCGQELPDDKKEDLEKQFNINKTNTLHDIKEEVARSQSSDKDIERLNETLRLKQAEEKDVIDQFNKALERHQALKEELESIEKTQVDFKETDEYKELESKKQALIKKMADANKETDLVIADYNSKLTYLKSELKDLLNENGLFSQIEMFESKINELVERDKELKEIDQETNRKLFLLEQFVNTKIGYIEEKANERFGKVKFKLFDKLQNGGATNICEAMVDNGKSLVGYNQGLNTGARILADVDIINTLSKEFGYKVPLFLDNAEALSYPIETDLQLIELKVDKSKNKLEVEIL